MRLLLQLLLHLLLHGHTLRRLRRLHRLRLMIIIRLVPPDPTHTREHSTWRHQGRVMKGAIHA